MAQDLKITVNGQSWAVNASPDTPLLYVLRNEFGLHGPRFGSGLGQCGLQGARRWRGGPFVRSAVTGRIVTLEELGTDANPHPRGSQS